VRETDELGILDQRPLALIIYYFPESPMEGDIDNIVKPIMDALRRGVKITAAKAPRPRAGEGGTRASGRVRVRADARSKETLSRRLRGPTLIRLGSRSPPSPASGRRAGCSDPVAATIFTHRLISVAYRNDKDVERLAAQKFEPQVGWDFADPSDQLAAALDAAPPVVYVRADDDPSWRRLS
jgi:hypothetical protein